VGGGACKIKREVEGRRRRRRRRVGSFQVLTYQAVFVAFVLVEYLSHIVLFTLNDVQTLKETFPTLLS